MRNFLPHPKPLFMPSRLLTAHLALFTVALLYGANYSIAKIAMPDPIPPAAFIMLRVLAASLLFWITSFWLKEKVAKADILRLAIASAFGVACNQLLFFKGLEMTSPISASLIMLTAPIVVLLFSVFFLGERLNSLKIIGIVLGVIGAAYLILNTGSSAAFKARNPLLGNLLIGGNAVAYSIYLIMIKPLTQKYQAITLLKWVFLFGCLYVLPFGGPGALAIPYSQLSAEIWAVLAFVLIGVTFLAYLLNAWALQRLPASVVSSYIYLQPLLAALVAILLAADELRPALFISAAFIFSGLFLISYKKRKPKLEEQGV